MSVSTNKYVTIVPIARPPGARPGALIARWHYYGHCDGDASGGSYTIQASLPGEGTMFSGIRLLFRIDTMSAWVNGAIVSTQRTIKVYSGERSVEGTLLLQYDDNIPTSVNITMQQGAMHGIPFVMACGVGASIQLVHWPNTNGTAVWFSAGGYLIDEQYYELERTPGVAAVSQA